MPGGEEDLSRQLPKEVVEKIRELYGLDKPLHVQYWNWLSRVVRLDFGRSFQPDGRPVLTKIGERLPITLFLNVVELIIIVALAVPIGVLSATRQYSTFDKVTTLFVFVGFATPDFWLALLLMILFGVQLGWLPISGLSSLNWEYLSFWQQQWDFLSHLILADRRGRPSAASPGSAATCGRACSRQSARTTCRRRAPRGCPRATVIGKHALRNALLPVVTVLGLSLPGLIGGSVIIESIFAIPGMGLLMVPGGLRPRLPAHHGQPRHRRDAHALRQPVRRHRLRARGSAHPPGRAAETLSVAGATRRGEMRQFWRTFRRNQLAVGGGFVVAVLVLFAIFAPAIAPWDPNRPDTKRVFDAALDEPLVRHRSARPRRPLPRALRRADLPRRRASCPSASPR